LVFYFYAYEFCLMGRDTPGYKKILSLLSKCEFLRKFFSTAAGTAEWDISKMSQNSKVNHPYVKKPVK
jgi:hypothetical protein